MAVLSVADSRNGTKPHDAPGASRRVVPLLGARIDRLLELRGLIRQAQEEERRLTAEVLAGLDASGLDRLAGQQAVATIEPRVTLRPDPALVHRALGDRAWAAMTVSVTAARRLMPAADLEAISEAATTRALRVEPREG